MRIPFLVFLAGCPASDPTPEAAPSEATGASAFAEGVEAALDRSVDACDDFYQHACGTWLENTEIPGDRSTWGRSFSVIDQRNDQLLEAILEEAAAAGDGNELGAFYTACLDEAAIDANGAEPLRSMLGRIAELPDRSAYYAEVGRLHGAGMDPLVSTWVTADDANPDVNVLNIGQGGLGLPDRSYYLDEARAELVGQYQAHVAAQLQHIGHPEAKAADAAARIVAFERSMAEHHWERAALRDSDKTYNPMAREALAELTGSGVPWDRVFEAMGAPGITRVVVSTPSVLEALPGVVKATDMATLRDYLTWSVVRRAASELSSDLVDEDFRFYGQVLQGRKEQPPRWQQCVDSVNWALGDLAGREFVARAFAGDSKDIALDMVNRIRAAFGDRMPALDWMDAATREAAVGKAGMVTPKIGYPDEGAWKTYDFEVTATDHGTNMLRAWEHSSQEQIAKAGQPVDRSEWFMPPQIVNAYYNPTANEIVFLAGIMQPPFFDASWPRAANYGAIGMVIGHELSHGFDDEGRKYDGEGRLNQWWDDEVVASFEERAECLVDAYGSFEVDGTPLNGELTLGENIADLGGVRMSLLAYRAWAAEQGAEPAVAGYEGDQVFFVAMAQAWCALQTPEREQMLLQVDPHSPPRYRVNGVVQHMPEFAEAFGCEAGSPMVATDACEIW